MSFGAVEAKRSKNALPPSARIRLQARVNDCSSSSNDLLSEKSTVQPPPLTTSSILAGSTPSASSSLRMSSPATILTGASTVLPSASTFSTVGIGQDRRKREEQDADGEVEPERREVFLVPARDELAGQLAGAQREHAQCPPHAAVEVQQRVRDVAGDFLHGKHVHVGGLPALRAVLAGDDRAAVEAARRIEGRRRQLVPRLEDAPLALHAAAESLRGFRAQARRVVLEIVIECRDALDPVADAPPLALARRRFRDLDVGPVETRAGQHVPHVSGKPGVVIRDDVRIELALDFVDEVACHAAAHRATAGS